MNVLVTGAYGGIGQAVCEAYAADGARLIITGRDQLKLAALARELDDKYQVTALAIAADVTDHTEVISLFKTINQTTQGLDVLVHCAGVLTQGPLMMTTASAIENDIAVNLTSSLIFCQQASKLMMRNKSGVITLLSSIVASQGSAGQAVYSASKAGLTGLIKSLAKELGPVGIRVNGIAPGFIETAMVEDFTEQAKAELIQKTSLGRLGSVADIAPVAVFLSSQFGGYITGQIISIDGGLTI